MPAYGTAAFDPDSLALIGIVPAPPGGATARMVFDGHRPPAYRLFVETITSLGPFADRVDIIDTGSPTVIAAGALPSDQRATDIAVVPVPPPLSDVRGSVVGGQVTVASGPVVAGKVVVDGDPLPEGTTSA